MTRLWGKESMYFLTHLNLPEAVGHHWFCICIYHFFWEFIGLVMRFPGASKMPPFCNPSFFALFLENTDCKLSWDPREWNHDMARWKIIMVCHNLYDCIYISILKNSSHFSSLIDISTLWAVFLHIVIFCVGLFLLCFCDNEITCSLPIVKV